MEAPLLRVEDLSTVIATPHGDVRAVDHVSFDLSRGETLGIVGESGSGKSMLVRTIMGITPRAARTTGRVLLDGRDLAELSPRAARQVWGNDVAMVFQDALTALNPVKRVGAHVTESLRQHLGMGRKDAARRTVELLEEVGIPDAARRAEQYPHELSGGMRQRVTIAVALACEPRLLIADEPTTALDVTVQRQILDLLARLQRERGMALVLITHDLGVVAGRTDRVAVMYGGRLVETAPTASLFDDVRHPYTEALLRSIPRVEQPSHTRLAVIPGRPPDLAVRATGCSFAPRCPLAFDLCREQAPALLDVAPGHGAACHLAPARGLTGAGA